MTAEGRTWLDLRVRGLTGVRARFDRSYWVPKEDNVSKWRWVGDW